jgi:hypothetical protein
MFKYKVQMHDMADGMATVVEVDYAVNWRPEIVNSEEVARACAAEYTVGSGRNMDNSYRLKFTGLSTILQA